MSNESSPEPQPKNAAALNDLRAYFEAANLPEQIQLNKETKITNVRQFINSHLSYCERNPDNFRALP